MAMGGAWSNDQLRDLILPPDFPSGSPHRVIGPDIPAVLTSFNAEYTWLFVDLWYYDNTQFYFEALVTNSFFGLSEWISGTYITANGVQLISFIDGPGGTPNSIHYGTDRYDTQRLQVDFRTADIAFTSTSTVIAPGIGYNNGGTAEAWQTFSFSNGWASKGGGFLSARYRRVAAPINCVQLTGAFAPGTKVDGTTIFTLPAGYRPQNLTGVCVDLDITVAAGGQAPHFAIASNGVVNCWGCASATTVEVNALFPLDLA